MQNPKPRTAPDSLFPIGESIVNGDTMEKDEQGTYYETLFECVVDPEDMDTPSAEAIVRRICWAYNACKGIPTNALVRMFEHNVHFTEVPVPFDPELGF